ncbi:MAG: P-loop NTPase [Syntrophales bacterium]|nr:P-loop NTPase [Syntrophales bacterium]
MNEQKLEGKAVLKLNIDFECDFKCESCEKFFDCDHPEKMKIYNRRRMSLAKKTMAKIKHKIAVVGGKGGTGKSTMSCNLAMALAMMGYKVSILDQDLDGASVPKMFGVMGKKLQIGPKGIVPVKALNGVEVISMGFVQEENEVITMFHEMRRGTTEEFLAHVDYGERDYLIIDLPPGTSSDSVNLLQYIPDLDGVVVVTVPPRVSQLAARKAILLAQKAGANVLGVVENMSGYICPDCGEQYDIMLAGGGEKLARDTGVPFLCRIPLHPELSEACDAGIPYVYKYPDNPASKIVRELAKTIDEKVSK